MKKRKKLPPKEPADAESTVKLEDPTVPLPRSDDSEQIERAVYDGMQDLRVKKPRSDK